jgi:hypothetical protein
MNESCVADYVWLHSHLLSHFSDKCLSFLWLASLGIGQNQTIESVLTRFDLVLLSSDPIKLDDLLKHFSFGMG